MQQDSARRTNRERTEATTAHLVESARKLFVEKGYAETATPDIVAAAGVTRGALYHHFADKQDLFRAVVEREAAAVAAAIEGATPGDLPAREALLAGGDAFLSAMSDPARVRLLLVDGPAILGRDGIDAIDARHATRSLKDGLAAAMEAGAMRRVPHDALAALLSSAWDRAALDIAQGADASDYREAIAELLDGLMRTS
ncbi:MAG: TetR/AcrR family transcriptional regulator [Rhizobiaceae bacterium]